MADAVVVGNSISAGSRSSGTMPAMVSRVRPPSFQRRTSATSPTLAPNNPAEVAARTIDPVARKRPTSAPYSSVADVGSTAAALIGNWPLTGASEYATPLR